MPEKLKVAKNSVLVRMYRQGLGDCFLLAFNGTDDKLKFMLIDSGVLIGTKNSTDIMTNVFKDIKEITSGHIDVLVVTHEHWDHISGFYQAEEVFKEIEIEQVWAAWTEDPENPLAQELTKKKKIYLDAVKFSRDKLKKEGMALADKLDGLLGFYGESLGMAAKKTSDIMDDLLKSGKQPIKYCYPGNEPQAIPNVEEVRFFVLGPPEEKSLIKKSDPSKTQSEVYLTDMEDDVLDGLALKLQRMSAVGDDDFRDQGDDDIDHPFESRFRIKADSRDNPEAVSFFEKHYKGEHNGWRNIDDKWMDLAGELALQLDKHTNNTSLVLAVEMVKTGHVLLFPGDAQVGNWLGWHELTWEVDGEEIDAENILKRTVFYKVGHHGSHNATLKEKGLELMTNSKLSAAIPVKRSTAEAKGWEMPYGPLYDRLKELCKGRVLRLDDGLKNKPDDVSESVWKSFKANIVQEDELYIDYLVK
jgi:hypothetical protein